MVWTTGLRRVRVCALVSSAKQADEMLRRVEATHKRGTDEPSFRQGLRHVLIRKCASVYGLSADSIGI
jgi:hypothetical protein